MHRRSTKVSSAAPLAGVEAHAAAVPRRVRIHDAGEREEGHVPLEQVG